MAHVKKLLPRLTTFKLLDQCKFKGKKKHLRKPIQVINYKTDILNKLKNYQYGRVSIANLTLNNQNEFMKCWASGTEATSLSG